jgi:hypothetical protein
MRRHDRPPGSPGSRRPAPGARAADRAVRAALRAGPVSPGVRRGADAGARRRTRPGGGRVGLDFGRLVRRLGGRAGPAGRAARPLRREAHRACDPVLRRSGHAALCGGGRRGAARPRAPAHRPRLFGGHDGGLCRAGALGAAGPLRGGLRADGGGGQHRRPVGDRAARRPDGGLRLASGHGRRGPADRGAGGGRARRRARRAGGEHDRRRATPTGIADRPRWPRACEA